MISSADAIRCPSCRKRNPLTETLNACARCGCELADLAHIHRTAQQYATLAAQALANADLTAANDYATEAWACRHSRRAAHLGFLATAAQGDWEQATEWLQLLKEPRLA